jgi:DNA-directed RNA polymerase specialized sigma subunit
MARVTKERLKKLQKVHKTDAKIGSLFGISRQAIHQLRVKYGIKAIPEKNLERDKKIAGLYKKGKTGIAIAKQTRLSVSQVYRIIKKYSR